MLGALAACSPKPVEQGPIRNPGNLANDAYPPRGWTWSPIPSAAPTRRYGVASPPRVPRAEVLILPERGPGEVWFPVVNALNARGYTVWLADPQPAPLRASAARRMVQEVVRGGSSGRLMVLGEGRGAVSALTAGPAARAMVLWSPVIGSPPIKVPEWEMGAARTLHLGQFAVLNQKPWREGGPKVDELAQAWTRANSSLRPRTPTYSDIYEYRADMTLAAEIGAKMKGVVVRTTGGDAAANAVCAAQPDCKPIAPGVEAMIAVFDKATEEVTLGAPPPPVGKKKSLPKT